MQLWKSGIILMEKRFTGRGEGEWNIYSRWKISANHSLA